MTDPGEKAARAPQLWGTPNPLTTGAPGGAGEKGVTPGEVQGTANVFGTSVTNGTGAKGTAGGQSKTDNKTVSHTSDSIDAESYGSTSASGGVTPSYKPIVGEYPTDNGAGHGSLLIGGRKPNTSS